MNKGASAERSAIVPIAGSAGLPCVVRALVGDEEAECLEYALKYAIARGVKPEQARLGEPLYTLGYAAKLVSITMRDPDTGKVGDREPTFTGASKRKDGTPYGTPIDEVLGELQRETIMYLFRIAEEWCDVVSPTRRKMSDAEMITGIRELAKEGDDGLRFFDACGPALRLSYMRSMARQLLDLLEPKSGAST